MNGKTGAAVAVVVIGVVVVSTLVYLGYINFTWGGGEDHHTTVVPPGTNYSKFYFSPVKKDATGTAVSSATVRSWFDANGDGMMQYSELGRFTESSGVYTTVPEFPIGADFHVWIQVQAANYFTRYLSIHMTGAPNLDGSAKSVTVDDGSSLEMCYVDDSLTYTGLINAYPWSNSVDYNYTLHGTQVIADVVVTGGVSHSGVESQVWQLTNYKSVYSALSTQAATKTYDYGIKWDEVDQTGIHKFYAPTFVGIQTTLQDQLDFGFQLGDWSGIAKDTTNAFMFSCVLDYSKLFYYGWMSSAEQYNFLFNTKISAAGSTLGNAYSVALWFNLGYDDMISGTWGASATYYLGTGGNDWDWIA